MRRRRVSTWVVSNGDCYLVKQKCKYMKRKCNVCTILCTTLCRKKYYNNPCNNNPRNNNPLNHNPRNNNPRNHNPRNNNNSMFDYAR